MHRILLSLINIASLCLARPLVDESSSPLSRGPSMGFPTQYLPKSRLSVNNRTNQTDRPGDNFKSPMIPSEHASLGSWVTYDFHRYAEPRLGEFVVSVSMRIIEFWLDEINAPIRTRLSARRRPYFDFEYIVEPVSRPGAVPTPVKLGLGYCWLLQEVLEQRLSPTVPGYVRANLYEQSYTMPFATLEVANRPVPSIKSGGATMTNDTVGTTQTSNKDTTTIVRPGANTTVTRRTTDLAVPSSRQKRWFTCYAKLIRDIVQMPKSGLVTHYSPGPPPGLSPTVPSTHPFSCDNAQEPGDNIIILVYPAAEAVATRPTWERVAKAALEFGANVAAISGDPRPGPVGPKRDIYIGNDRVMSLHIWINAASEASSATA